MTVCILSHRAGFLPGAVDSVLRQTLYASGQVQLLVQHDKENWPNKLNQIMKTAVGEYCVILCDDDLLAPTFLERCLHTAARGTAGGADIVYTDRVRFEGDQRPWEGEGFYHHEHGLAYLGDAPDRYYVTQPPEDFFELGSTLPMTMLFRRSLWEELGGYDDAMPHADTEFFARCGFRKARMHYLPEPLFWYRSHPEQYSKEQGTSMDAFLVAFSRKHFLRFGLPFELAKKVTEHEVDGNGVELQPGWWKVGYVPPALRVAYARVQYPEFAHVALERLPEYAHLALERAA